MKEAERICLEQKRKEAQRKELVRIPPGGRCPRIFSDPYVQTYAKMVASELESSQYLTSLSIRGTVQAFANHLAVEIDRQKSKRNEERYRKYGPRDYTGIPEVSAEQFREAAKGADFITWQVCFPQLVGLLAEHRNRVQDRELAEANAAAEAAKPDNRLRQAYFSYMVVKRCYDVRLGYQLVYINEVELERAKRAVTAIEASAVTEDSSIDLSKTWQEATRLIAASTEYVERYFCQKTYNDLMNAAPYSPPEKDFGIQRH